MNFDSANNRKIGNIILDNYNSIYLLNISTGILEPYFFNSDVAKTMIDIIGDGIDYTTIFNLFRDRFVLKEERDTFTMKTDLKYVLRELDNFGHFYYIFGRKNTIGVPEYIEMYVVRFGDKDHAVVCFRTVSEDVNQIKTEILNSDSVTGELGTASGRRTVLIIEDDPINMSILKDILNDYFNVLCASNGKEGLEILRKNYRQMSAVLLDIYMPVMNGYEFLEAVNNDSMLAQIPVIVTMTGRRRNRNALIWERWILFLSRMWREWYWQDLRILSDSGNPRPQFQQWNLIHLPDYIQDKHFFIILKRYLNPILMTNMTLLQLILRITSLLTVSMVKEEVMSSYAILEKGLMCFSQMG